MRWLILALVGFLVGATPATAEPALTDVQLQQLHQDICRVPAARRPDSGRRRDARWTCAEPRDYPGRADDRTCPLSLRPDRIYRGRFTALEAQALIGYEAACEPHATNFGGTALFRVVGERFQLIRFLQGALADCVVSPEMTGLQTLYCVTSYMGQGELDERFGPMRFTPNGELRLDPWIQAGNVDGYLTEMVDCAKSEPGLHHLIGIETDWSRGDVVLEAATLDPASFAAACRRYRAHDFDSGELKFREMSSTAAAFGFVRSEENRYRRVRVRFHVPDPTPSIDVTTDVVPQK